MNLGAEASAAALWCAEHVRQLGGESPYPPDGGEGLVKRKGSAASGV